MAMEVPPIETRSESAEKMEGTPSIRAPLIITVYFVTVFTSAALLSPWFYLAINHFSTPSEVANAPFYRYVSRLLLLIGLLGLFPLLRTLRITSLRQLGFGYKPTRFREWSIGFMWGVLLLAFVAALSIFAGQRTWNFAHEPAEWASHWRSAFMTALLVGLIEETLFRGALFGGLRKVSRFWTAALISAAIYAILHFFQKPPTPMTIDWTTGFVALGSMLKGFADWQTLVPAFFNLTILGVILARAYEKTGGLFLPWGIHSGLIICAKTFPFITDATPATNNWIWGSDKLIDGWLSGVAMLFMYLCLSLQFPAKAILPKAHVKSAS
jgi:membrane protease YdiL (CAAX protease family)